MIRYPNKGGYGLHEVYYDADGQPWGMTERAVGFVGDTADEVEEALLMAHADARQRPILDQPEKWPGKSPGAA